MMRPIVYMLIAALFAFGPLPAEAAKLTAKEIKASAAAMPAMTKLGKKYKMDENKKKNPNDMSMDFSKEFRKGLKDLRAKGGYGEASAIVRKHGFSSPEQWIDVTARVMRAYVSLSMAQSGANAAASKAQIKQSMATIQNNPQFPAAQKKQIMAQMRAALKMMNELENVSPADKAAVKPHMAALTKMMKEMPDADRGRGGMGGGMGGGRRR